jgi:hypothetical protein
MKAAEIENKPGVETPLDIENEIRQGLDEFSFSLTEFGSARFDQSELSFINSIVGSELIPFTGDSYCTVPDCPGIYIFHDSHNRRRALYKGQASNLRKRIYSSAYVERVSCFDCAEHTSGSNSGTRLVRMVKSFQALTRHIGGTSPAAAVGPRLRIYGGFHDP